MGIGVAHGVQSVLHRHHPADVLGGTRTAHVGPDVRGEVAAGPGQQRGGEGLGHRQGPHGVGVGLLLVGHGQHPLVDARGDQVGGHQGRRASDRAGGVHPDHGLAHRTERRGQVELGHHVALEHVGGLADDHGVDVAPVEVGVGQGHLGRLPHQAGDGHVVPLGLVVGLPHADDRAALCHHAPSRTQTRFCCRQGPEVAWATARRAWPARMRGGRLADADEAGRHDRVGGQRPARRVDDHPVVEAERLAHDDLLWAKGAWSSATSTGPSATPATLGRLGGRRRGGQVAGAEGVGLHPVVDAGDPHRAATRTRPCPRRPARWRPPRR